MHRFLRSEGLASDFAKALLGNIANSSSVFVATILLVRAFPQQEFAQIGVALAYAFVLAKILDAGISFTALRFSARKDLAGDQSAYLGAMHLVIASMAALCLAFVGVLIPVSEQFSGEVLGAPLYAATVATAWGIVFHGAVRSQLQATCSYNRLLAFHLLAAGLRLVLVAAFWMLPGTVVPALLLLYFVPILGASIFIWCDVFACVRNFMTQGEGKALLLRNMFTYAPWVWISGTLYVATLRAPVFVLERWGEPGGVAVFTAALSFVSLIALANDAARAVIIPRSAGFSTRADFDGYFDKIGKVMHKIIFALVPLLLASGGLVALLLPAAYLPDSIYAFYALAAAMLAASMLGMVTNLIHAVGKPQVEAVVNLFRALLCLAGCYLLTRHAGGGIVLLAGYTAFVVVLFEVLMAYVVRHHVRVAY